VRARRRIAELIARETGQAVEKVFQDIDRDYWMSAQEAIDYRLVGRMISARGEL
jgi:ATP-dependent Clp protease protease subunit